MGSQDDINNDDNDVSNNVNASPEEELRDVVLSTMTIYLLGFWLEWLVLEEPWHVFWELSRPAKTSGRVVGQLSPLLISFKSKYQIFNLILKSLFQYGFARSIWNHTCLGDTNRKASADSLLIFLLYSHPFLLEERLFIGRCHPGNYVVGGSVLKKNYLTSMRAAVFKVLLTNNKV